jgi:hypothetical protein
LGSTASRFLSVALVLPLLLRQFTPAEIAVWYLLSTMIGLQTLADLGFAPTFTRLIAYAMGGSSRVGETAESRGGPRGSSGPNWNVVEAIWSSMRVLYWRVTALAVVFLGVLGTLSLLKPMAALEDQRSGWMAWAIVLSVSGAGLWANAFAAYLQGVNQVALFRRWEALTSLGAILTSVAVLLMGGRLLALVVANQVWAAGCVVRNRQLARRVEGGRLSGFSDRGLDPEVFRVAWPAAWRSGLGISFSRGALYASGPIYAQVAEAAAVSSYLLAFRLIQVISELSQAPFYSKIPMLARLRSEGRVKEQLSLAEGGMRWAYWTYAAAFIVGGATGAPALRTIGSHVDFVDPHLWALLGLGLFVERYGAMHLQLYTTANHIIWHVANGASGAVYLGVSLALLPLCGVYAFPLGVLAGYAGFYAWYSAIHSYRQFGLRFWAFEKRTSLLPFTVVVVYVVRSMLS